MFLPLTPEDEARWASDVSLPLDAGTRAIGKACASSSP
jgi:hypothetical protein